MELTYSSRQQYGEYGAGWTIFLNFNPAAVSSNDAVANGEAEAGAPTCRFGRIERIENVAHNSYVDTGSRV